jgi:glycosidase
MNDFTAKPYLIMEFHISRQARDVYQFDQSLFSTNGNVIFANFHASRIFAQKMNQKRNLVNYPEGAVKAGQINAMGLIDEILHLVIEKYRQERNPDVMGEALTWLNQNLDQKSVDEGLSKFCANYPPLIVYQNKTSVDDYLQGTTGGIPHRQILLEEMLMLWIANANPAFAPYMELFDDSDLEKATSYRKIIKSLHDYFDTQPRFGPEDQNLVDMLRSPAIAEPHSLTGQLEYIRTRWGYLIGQYLYRLLSSLDLIREEEKAIFFGPGPAVVYDFSGLDLELERFSPDKDWMPNLVLIAKNTFVWLDQLSKKYRRSIRTLDQVPQEELDTYARWGFSGLWLIGLWERSPASQQIKQMRGNPDAVASAYSLFEYTVAEDLGGEQAYKALRDKAWQRGIRLASDMVPNHMGIDSRWAIEHPDWFIALDHSPFPSYSFNGPNLSWDERVGIYLEDHYYDNSDAAVVFKRVDHWSGQQKYIYHGNDGTSMPWNDTAQLDFLHPEVREAVIQTILSVARKFPIIRFDAAMTLAKKHYQRLWYPEPGSGGDIPSRAEHGITKEQFNAAMPVEFWREVVDRVAQEVPDTLLLAEAFWLMEGYFVRTLGMHRVYNSAFMNMLRDEKNQDYRLVIKNTLEFDPEILKRYVNFMNNPDERTAVDQFGKDDKYFGICTMMATMPGLPMFGHGQIEGFTEKYGMEYKRAYWDEYPDEHLVARHEREIFPLLRRRYLFAEVNDFLLYNFFTPEGIVNEDVFAYSNRAGEERALVIYHNRYANARGWIRTSSAVRVKNSSAPEPVFTQKSLGEGLGLVNDGGHFTIFRDHLTGREYIRNNRELIENGLYIELGAYKCHVFIDFRQVADDQWGQYRQLANYLDGRGVPNIDEALKEVFLQSVHQPFRDLVNSGQFQWIIDNRLVGKSDQGVELNPILDEVEGKARHLLQGIIDITKTPGSEQEIAKDIRTEIGTLMRLQKLADISPNVYPRKFKSAAKYLLNGVNEDTRFSNGLPITWGTLLGWAITHKLGKIVSESGYNEISRSWIDEWLLGKIIANALTNMGISEPQAWRSVGLIKILIGSDGWFDANVPNRQRAYEILYALLKESDVQRFLGINRYQDVLWFNEEAFEELLWWLYISEAINTLSDIDDEQEIVEEIVARFDVIKRLLKAEGKSAFQVDELLAAVK